MSIKTNLRVALVSKNAVEVECLLALADFGTAMLAGPATCVVVESIRPHSIGMAADVTGIEGNRLVVSVDFSQHLAGGDAIVVFQPDAMGATA